MKVAFITDSGTGKSIHEYQKEGIISLPLQITIEDKTYQDMENLNRNDCIRLMKEGKVLTTSQPSPGLIEECFESLKEQGVKLIVAVPICNGLSGTISTMTAIANSLDMKIICIDTYVTAVVQDYLITQIKKWYEEGKSHLEIQIKVDEIINSTNTLIVPETLDQLIRGGRITPLAARLGKLLKIIPVLQINKKTSGKVDTLLKVRTFRKALSSTIDEIAKDNPNEKTLITIAHVANVDEAMNMYHQMSQRFPTAKIQVIELPNAIAVHTGLGCIAIQYFQTL
ncbi:MAG: DegV family protein [Erysipelotrichaceae bacterium]|nr:DegV family protein [Erysipelotrichaceae bacterium]MDY6035251.1 DegV family protein [Bulleidia sp.]